MMSHCCCLRPPSSSPPGPFLFLMHFQPSSSLTHLHQHHSILFIPLEVKFPYSEMQKSCYLILISAYYCVTQIPGRSRTFHLWPGQLAPALPSPLLCPNHHRCADPVLKLHVGAVPGLCPWHGCHHSTVWSLLALRVPTVILYRRAVLLGVWILVSCCSCQGAPGMSPVWAVKRKAALSIQM